MKKLTFLIPLMFLMACGTYKTFSVAKLQLGMTKVDVEQMSGAPKRILAVTQTEYGRQEILEYKTTQNEIYALEFMNDHLVRYEFLGDEVVYIPPPLLPPPVIVVHEYPTPPKPAPRPSPPPATPPASIHPDEQKRPVQENPQTRPPSRRQDSGATNQARPSESTGQVKTGESEASSQRPSRRSRN